jgi:protein ImuA
MASSARDIIEGLRDEIRRIERRPSPSARCLATGDAEIDALLPGGGFPRGALTELAGAPGCGKTEVALAAIARALREEGLAAFVDGRGELYPPAAAALGVDLDRLLIVRPAARVGDGRGDAVRRAWWAAETVLASGAFAIVALDLPAEDVPARAEAGLRRLRAAAERGAAAALWLAGEQGVRVPAALRLEVVRAAGRPRVRQGFARAGAGSGGGAAALLAAYRSPGARSIVGSRAAEWAARAGGGHAA